MLLEPPPLTDASYLRCNRANILAYISCIVALPDEAGYSPA
jgi:hypothetical protein